MPEGYRCFEAVPDYKTNYNRMKRFYFACMILLLYSCGKENLPETPAANFSLLQKYNWQQVRLVEPFIPNHPPISYFDTSTYSFTRTQYTFKEQGTVVHLKAGIPPTYFLEKLSSTTSGAYELNASDSLIVMEYHTKVGELPGWGVEGIDTVIRTRFKILVLNEQRLELKPVPYKPVTLPFPETIETYTAVSK